MLIHFKSHCIVVCGFALALAISPVAASPTPADAQTQEYLQVRKIAMKDPKVRAAFDKAGEKLDRRIVEIDPSLRAYVERNKSSGTVTRTTQSVPTTESNMPATKHIVAKGETLSSIARRFKTSVAKLKSCNQITDERKLKVGQQLIIPSATSAAAPHASEHATWGKIKPDF